MDNPKPKWRLQFSLLSLAMLIVIVALAVSHWQTSQRLTVVSSENRRFRDELAHLVGKLTVEDKTKFHAVALETNEPNTWQWRMFVPKGTRYRWCLASEEIPRNSPPKQAQMMGVSNAPPSEQDNEVVVTAKLRENDDGTWALSVTSFIGDSKNQMAGATLKIPAEKMAWTTVGPGTDGHVIGSNGTAIRDPKGPIILLQKRGLELQPSGRYQPSANPMPGYMIWLESW